MMFLAIIAAIIAPFFYGVLNVIDERFTQSLITRVQTLMFYVTITNLLFCPVLFIFYPFQVPSPDVLFLTLICGVLFVLAALPYFKAFHYTDTSIVAALMNMSFLFVPIIAFVAIGEVISPTQYFGFLITIFAAVFLSLKKGVKFGINAALWLMALSGFLWSAKEVGTKAALAETNVASIYFFLMLFSTLFILLLNISKENRLEITKSWPVYRANVGWFILSESLQIAAMGFAMFAMVYLPVTIVVGLNQFQPIFALLTNALLLFLLGKHNNEALDKESICKKLICFILMILGAVLLVS